jgi:muramoyltetrapeptide carboxypeptidase LdcA involved in peptidoglycan recycling
MPVTPHTERIPTPVDLDSRPTIRVIAPSLSAAVITSENQQRATTRLEELGFRVTFGEHVQETGPLDKATTAARVADLHAAFADPDVDLVLTAIGGYASNDLLPHLDWDLIRGNPKAFCGFSDITALQNAFLSRAGMVSYSGPHWSTFGCVRHLESTVAGFLRAVTGGEPWHLIPSPWWSDDRWYLAQDDRTLLPNPGWWTMRPGETSGPIIGGNLSTISLLCGTRYFPAIEGAVLFVEDDAASTPQIFARQLTGLLQQPTMTSLSGLVIGRFQRETGMTRELLAAIIDNQPLRHDVPVLANGDFGHTLPLCTIPIGGTAELNGHGDEVHVRVSATPAPSVSMT